MSAEGASPGVRLSVAQGARPRGAGVSEVREKGGGLVISWEVSGENMMRKEWTWRESVVSVRNRNNQHSTRLVPRVVMVETERGDAVVEHHEVDVAQRCCAWRGWRLSAVRSKVQLGALRLCHRRPGPRTCTLAHCVARARPRDTSRHTCGRARAH